MTVLLLVAVLAAATIGVMNFWRWTDIRSDQQTTDNLLSSHLGAPAVFEVGMISDLPEPVRRYFIFSIQPGTLLHRRARVDMAGDFSLGSKSDPKYQPMSAQEILALPAGALWKTTMGKGLTTISGSDGLCDQNGWTRFWYANILPVARLGGNADHACSAFGRFVAESVFWCPAAVLPSQNASWGQIDANTGRLTYKDGNFQQMVDITVAADGRPIKVSFLRWSDANPQKRYQWQPFGGFLSEFKNFNGFTVATHVEAGNFFETDDYFPFFRADVSHITFSS